MNQLIISMARQATYFIYLVYFLMITLHHSRLLAPKSTPDHMSIVSKRNGTVSANVAAGESRRAL